MVGSEKTGSAAWKGKSEYVRLARAAELLGCSVDELLHLGAIGEVTILAPVVAEGEYEWPVSETGQESWYEPFQAKFDASHRVILHRRDVAKIEAVGWVIPRLFFAPDVVQKIWGHLKDDPVALDRDVGSPSLSNDVTQTENVRTKFQHQEKTVNLAELAAEHSSKTTALDKDGASSSSEVTGDERSRIFALIMAHANTVPWFPVDTRPPVKRLKDDAVAQIEDKGENRTIAEHLFLSMGEIERLQENAPQDGGAEQRRDSIVEPRKPHGNSSRFSNNREEVLMAAIACLFNNGQEIKMTGTQWAEIIDEKGAVFWKTRTPPLVRSEIAKLLNKAKSYPDNPPWEGRTSE